MRRLPRSRATALGPLPPIYEQAESMDEYKKRLAITAKRLPRQMLHNCLGRIKANIEETENSRGRHTRVD